MFTLTANESILRAARKSDEMLEPYEWKRSRTVLRRERASNRPDLADYFCLINPSGNKVLERTAAASEGKIRHMEYQALVLLMNLRGNHIRPMREKNIIGIYFVSLSQ